MSIIAYDVKDPSAITDYHIDWTPFLVTGEVITASTWTPTRPDGTLDNGITVVSTTLNSPIVTVRLSGGVVGDPTHMIVNHITTNHDRQDDQTFYIDIWET